MELPQLIKILDTSDLTRQVKSSNTGYGDIITYSGSSVTVDIDSEVYEPITQICLMMKNELCYVYLQKDNLRFYYKVALSSITSFSIQ